MRAVGVIIPARNEATRVGACLGAVLEAVDRLAPSVRVAVCLVVDRSQDATADEARHAVRRRTEVDVLVSDEPSTIGAVRNRAARAVLTRLGSVPASEIVLLSTDADSQVPVGWAARHLELARSGAHAVFGGVVPDGPSPPGLLTPDGVYAANLGVVARPFLDVGGFPAVSCGEDEVLRRRLVDAGHHVLTGAGIHVRTSVRTRGRAVGGLADLLRTGAG